MSLWSKLTSCLLLSALIVGCSGGAPAQTTAKLTGEVKRMSGEPVGGVTVVFHPTTGQPVVTKTDDAGKFTVDAPLGDCKVAVIATTDAPADSSPAAAQAVLDKQTKIKPQFASPESSGLSVNVKASQTDKTVFVVE